MRTKSIFPRALLTVLLFATALGLLSCTREAEGLPKVWIDSPRTGSRVPLDQPVLIHSHAFAAEGLAEVVLSVDGQAYLKTAPEEEADFSAFQQEWLPPGAGSYTLQLVAYDLDGERSSPATITITVGAELAADEPAEPQAEVPPEAPAGAESTCPPLAVARANSYCRSGPGEEYGTLDLLAEGESAVVAGRSENGSWWVIERPSGSGNCWIWGDLVEVAADSCPVAVVAAPPPPAVEDLEPPPAPQPAVPAEGLALSCRATQTLAWLPVDDPSGIAGYYLLVKKEVSPGTWENLNQWGPIAGKQQEISVDCGLNYRWSVRAEDQAGNFSDWSTPASFSIELD